MLIEDHPKHEQNEDLARIDLAAFRDILFLFLFYLNLLFFCDNPQSRSRGEKKIPRSRDLTIQMNDERPDPTVPHFTFHRKLINIH